MVYFLCRNKSAFLLALLAERMLTDVSVTDAFPGTAVLLVDVRVTLVLVVLSAGISSVVSTVLLVREPWTSRIRTRSLGFAGHFFHLLGA